MPVSQAGLSSAESYGRIPPFWLAALICGMAVALWGMIRLLVFRDMVMPLTYALPLLICLWARDQRLLWSMALIFAAFASLKTFWILPEYALTPSLQFAAWSAQIVNISVASVVVAAIMRLREWLEQRNRSLERSNRLLTARDEQISRQNEELAAQSEELAQQNEELRAQGEELEQQSEELRATNEELSQRENMLQTLLVAARGGINDEMASGGGLQHICEQGVELLGEDVHAAAVLELTGARPQVHASIGLNVASVDAAVAAGHGSLAVLAMREERTIGLDDVSRRPDLRFARGVRDETWQAVLAAPLRVGGRCVGAVEFYAVKARLWSEAQFRLAEWVAGQCSAALDMIRLQDDLRHSQRRLRLAVEAAELGVWLYEPDTDRWEMDARAGVLYGMGEGLHRHDRATIERIVHPDDTAALWQQLTQAFNPAGDGRYEAEYRVRRADGTWRWVQAWGRVEFDRQGESRRPLRMIGISRDTTQRKDWETRLHDAKEVAESANRAKDQFLAALSHELRTPLTPALTTAEMLSRDKALPESLRQDTEVIRRNIELEARLIDDLLDVTRITRGKVELQRREVVLEEVIGRAVEVCRGEIEARGLRLSLELNPRPHHVHADPARLQQVFWNLLKNAVKFTPAGGRLGVRSRHGGDDHVTVEVFDEGEGIDPKVLPRLFNPFEQGSVQVTRQFGGLGLGLAISKGLVDLHGGRITAHSDGPGCGAVFSVSLPLAGAVSPEPAPAPAELRAAGGGVRILLVEDHADTARVMTRLLSKFGYEVCCAGDCTAALREAQDSEFGLIISDLGLPDGSGVDLLAEMRRRGVDCPAIALSGFGREEDLQRSREAGFAAHLVKPISPDRLVEAIGQATTGMVAESGS